MVESTSLSFDFFRSDSTPSIKPRFAGVCASVHPIRSVSPERSITSLYYQVVFKELIRFWYFPALGEFSLGSGVDLSRKNHLICGATCDSWLGKGSRAVSISPWILRKSPSDIAPGCSWCDGFVSESAISANVNLRCNTILALIDIFLA